MRGQTDPDFPVSFAIHLKGRIRPDHPPRPIKTAADAILHETSPLFDAAYAGRPSVLPKVLLRALPPQCLHTVRGEARLVERTDTDPLFRWFRGLDPAEPVSDATAFTHNRPGLDRHGITATLFNRVVQRAVDARLTSDEYFSVDGTLIESYASITSFLPVDQKDQDEDSNGGSRFKPRNAEVNSHGQRRSNKTQRSRTDPEPRLYKMGDGQAPMPCRMGHA